MFDSYRNKLRGIIQKNPTIDGRNCLFELCMRLITASHNITNSEILKQKFIDELSEIIEVNLKDIKKEELITIKQEISNWLDNTDKPIPSKLMEALVKGSPEETMDDLVKGGPKETKDNLIIQLNRIKKATISADDKKLDSKNTSTPLRISFLGGSASGKTELIKQLSNQVNPELNHAFTKNHEPTIGISRYQVKNTREAFEFYDIPTEERYNSFVDANLKQSNADLVVVCVDRFNNLSLEGNNGSWGAEQYIQKVRQAANKGAEIILVQTKTDLEASGQDKTCITEEQIRAFKERYDIQGIKVSAKTGTGITELYSYLTTRRDKKMANLLTEEKQLLEKVRDKHSILFNKDRQCSFFGRLYRTEVKETWTLEQYISHAMDKNNRTREVLCQDLKWLDKHGKITKEAPEIVREIFNKLTEEKESSNRVSYK
ncbi:small GTP-binding protein domain [Legionella beliardensis]|uniref:Small GTP-binding protein domain n=1 Tax=Legionella beliardensis TaxID=91822 RepID=A0A378I3M6_9GAMM|nr:ADP-ribosylation factor-like protein [Legionella beliardensis]STX29779.1 small GTP-binding protein domain [Legionella beliardensis]